VTAGRAVHYATSLENVPATSFMWLSGAVTVLWGGVPPPPPSPIRIRNPFVAKELSHTSGWRILLLIHFKWVRVYLGFCTIVLCNLQPLRAESMTYSKLFIVFDLQQPSNWKSPASKAGLL